MAPRINTIAVVFVLCAVLLAVYLVSSGGKPREDESTIMADVLSRLNQLEEKNAQLLKAKAATSSKLTLLLERLDEASDTAKGGDSSAALSNVVGGSSWVHSEYVECDTKDKPHMPIYKEFKCVKGLTGATTRPDGGYGTVTPVWMLEWGKSHHSRPLDVLNDQVLVEHPEMGYHYQDPDYYEFAAILETVALAAKTSNKFVMFEIGSGWSRWSTHGALLAKQKGLVPLLVTVEADPHHYRMGRSHMLLNGISEAHFMAFNAIMNPTPADGQFMRSNPDEHYGAAAGTHGASASVRSVTLEHLVSLFFIVDHIDFDCQTCEQIIFTPENRPLLDARVKSMWIECHGVEIGQNLEKLFTEWGWTIRVKLTPKEQDFGWGPIKSESNQAWDLWVTNPKYFKEQQQEE